MKTIKWTGLFMVVLVAGLALAQGQAAHANAAVCASAVFDSLQGLMKNGQPVSARGYPNCNPSSALGPADSTYDHHETFFSLGYGGWIILDFGTLVGCSITVYEVTWGEFPAETADVYASEDGSTWDYLGSADNSVGMGGNDPHPTEFTLSSCVRYVKIVDTTDSGPHADESDAFDVDAVCAGCECPEEFEGCTPGYWKNHPGAWVTWSSGELVGTAFPNSNIYGLDVDTLLDALKYRGGPRELGAARILLRAAVAALLNATHLDVDYPRTEPEIIAAVNDALSTEDRETMLQLASELDDDNNLGCPLN